MKHGLRWPAWVLGLVVLPAVAASAAGQGQAAGQTAAAQAAAAQAAARWQDTIRNLRHPDVKVRLSAVEQLGEAGYTAAAEYVAPLVTDPDDRVQFAAIDAELTFFLNEPIGARRVFSLTGGSRSRAQEAFDAGPLVRIASPAPLVLIDNLITAMRDDNARIRFDAVHALGVIAEAPLPPAQAKSLLDGLDHYDPVIRVAAARVIGRLRVASAGDKLIAGLNDSNLLVRRYSAEAVGRIREVRAVQSLTELADYYGPDEMGVATLLALARIGHASSRDLFRQRLTDVHPAVRGAAAEGAGRLGDRESLETLRSMMTSDSSASARLAATFAVGLLDQPQAHLIAAGLAAPDTKAQATDYLLELGSSAVNGVQAALRVANAPRFRADLVHLLGFLGGRDAAAAIQPYLADPDPGVTRAAADAVARLNRS